MLRTLFVFIITTIAYCFFTSNVSAQGREDLWVMPNVEPWNIAHRVTKGETIFMLARRYHVPPAILADANGLTYNDGLKDNTTLIVPLGAYNLQAERPANPGEAKALYYKVQKEDNFHRISRHTNVSQKVLAGWNNMEGRDVYPGQTLLVGWVLYDATSVNNVPVAAINNNPRGNVPAPVKPSPASVRQADTPKYVMRGPNNSAQPNSTITALTDPQPDTTATDTPPAPNSLEAQYLEETSNGENVVNEKGAASFYKVTSTAKGVASIAFHNKAAKGSVIKVKNTNNGRYVYVKVMGPVPTTKQYYNCIIGLSDKVQKVLGVRDAKAFCELSYAGY